MFPLVFTVVNVGSTQETYRTQWITGYIVPCHASGIQSVWENKTLHGESEESVTIIWYYLVLFAEKCKFKT